jgi:hypothetical protein
MYAFMQAVGMVDDHETVPSPVALRSAHAQFPTLPIER